MACGSLRRATPGHTPEHLAWEVFAAGADRPTAVLTGGSLLVGSAGRTDLLGADAAEELTRAQFASLRALARLPEDVAVLPTHGSGSFCAAGPVDGGRTSTIGAERRMNPLLAAPDEAAFRAALLGGLGAYPTYYEAMAPINRAGPVVRGRPPLPRILDAAGFRAAVAAGAHVIDGRSRAEFAAGHLPGVAQHRAQRQLRLVRRLVRALRRGRARSSCPSRWTRPSRRRPSSCSGSGTTGSPGCSRAAPAAWADAGIGSLDAYPTTTIEALHAQAIAGADGYALDVRDPHEWREDGVVPGAIRIPLGELADRLASIPRDAPVTVMCRPAPAPRSPRACSTRRASTSG